MQNLSVSFESRAVFLAGLEPAVVLDMATKAIKLVTGRRRT